jgi:hypothetical protein
MYVVYINTCGIHTHTYIYIYIHVVYIHTYVYNTYLDVGLGHAQHARAAQTVAAAGHLHRGEEV